MNATFLWNFAKISEKKKKDTHDSTPRMRILFESHSVPNEEREVKVTDLGPIYLSIQRIQGEN